MKRRPANKRTNVNFLIWYRCYFIHFTILFVGPFTALYFYLFFQKKNHTFVGLFVLFIL